MSNSTSEWAQRRIRSYREELVVRITGLLSGDGELNAHPYLILNRLSTPVSRDYTLFQPVVCIAIQGTKQLILGGETYRYDPEHYLISTVELPIMYILSDVSDEHPYLGIRIILNPSLVASVLMDHGGKVSRVRSKLRAMDVGPIDADMLSTAVRMIRLLEDQRKQRSQRSPVLGRRSASPRAKATAKETATETATAMARTASSRKLKIDWRMRPRFVISDRSWRGRCRFRQT